MSNLPVRHETVDFGMVGHLRDARLSRAERQHSSYATDDLLKLNAVAIESRQGMAISIYPVSDDHEDRIWIQTNLAGDETSTTILLPEDYHPTGVTTIREHGCHESGCRVNQLAEIRKIMHRQFHVLSLAIVIGALIRGAVTNKWAMSGAASGVTILCLLFLAPLVYSRARSLSLSFCQDVTIQTESYIRRTERVKV